LFTGTVAGVCNFIARMGAIFAPLVAEVVPPYPMIIFISLMLFACGMIQRLEVPDQK
jgi:hypothetical protein